MRILRKHTSFVKSGASIIPKTLQYSAKACVPRARSGSSRALTHELTRPPARPPARPQARTRSMTSSAGRHPRASDLEHPF